MWRKLVAVCVMLALIGLGLFWVLTIPETVDASTLPQRTPDLANGRLMLAAGGCVSCHKTPNQENRDVLGGGMALHSPFGTFYVPNISPHADALGGWTEAQFVSAMWRGTSPGGGHYYPAFPYASYRSMKLEDLQDLFAHLKTLPPVEGRVRDHDLPFPFNIRRTLGGWKLLFNGGPTWRDDPAQSVEWNRGAYLVNGPGHCAECHSPRNFLGGIVDAQRLAGGPNPEGKGWVPNITQKGLADWSAPDIADFLKSGLTPEGDFVGGAMAPVVANMSKLPDGDIKAIAVYLKSLPPVEGPARPQ